jgi:hypothetical protein
MCHKYTLATGFMQAFRRKIPLARQLLAVMADKTTGGFYYEYGQTYQQKP